MEVGVGVEGKECKSRNANEIVATVVLCHVALAEAQLQINVWVYGTQTQIIFRKTTI